MRRNGQPGQEIDWWSRQTLQRAVHLKRMQRWLPQVGHLHADAPSMDEYHNMGWPSSLPLTAPLRPSSQWSSQTLQLFALPAIHCRPSCENHIRAIVVPLHHKFVKTSKSQKLLHSTSFAGLQTQHHGTFERTQALSKLAWHVKRCSQILWCACDVAMGTGKLLGLRNLNILGLQI